MERSLVARNTGRFPLQVFFCDWQYDCPILAIYLLSFHMKKHAYIGVTAWFFGFLTACSLF